MKRKLALFVRTGLWLQVKAETPAQKYAPCAGTQFDVYLCYP